MFDIQRKYYKSWLKKTIKIMSKYFFWKTVFINA